MTTSEHLVFVLRRPDRPTIMKVLMKKSYHFVEDIWEISGLYNINKFCVIQHVHVHCRNNYFSTIRPLEMEDDSSEDDDDLAEDGETLSSEDESETESDTDS